MIDFAEITDFEWEQLVFVAPYTTVSNVLEEVGANWARPVTYIQNSDVNALLLFVNENDVVAFVHFPRHRVDFVQIMQHNSFSRSETVFAVVFTVIFDTLLRFSRCYIKFFILEG